MAKTFKNFRAGIITESPVDGVAKGSLDGDKHMCASKIMHKEWNEGTPIIGEHAEPVDGKVAWYKVCLLYTSPSPRDMRRARMPSSA